jgi:hypothetical protein
MTERELSDHLRDLVESIGIRETTSKFISERDIKAIEFQHADNKRKFAKKDTRTEQQRIVNADCILLEYILVEEELVLPPTDKLHDFGVDIYRIDNKDLSGPYYWPTMANIDWMQRGIDSGDLTHFMFTRMHRPINGAPLKTGDNVKIDFLKVVNAQLVLDNLEEYRKKDGTIVKRYRVL